MHVNTVFIHRSQSLLKNCSTSFHQAVVILFILFFHPLTFQFIWPISISLRHQPDRLECAIVYFQFHAIVCSLSQLSLCCHSNTPVNSYQCLVIINYKKPILCHCIHLFKSLSTSLQNQQEFIHTFYENAFQTHGLLLLLFLAIRKIANRTPVVFNAVCII